MTHEAIAELTAHGDFEGSLPLVEYKCENNSNYTVVRAGSNYCPLCGEEL